MPKVKYMALVICLVFILAAGRVSARVARDPSRERLENCLDLGFFDYHWTELERESGNYLPVLGWRDFLLKAEDGGAKLDPGQIAIGLWRYLAGEVILNIRLFGQLLFLSVAAAFLKNLETAFGREQVATLTRAIIFVVLIGVVMYSFGSALNLARDTVGKMVDFSLALLPTLIALLASLGSLASSAIFHPLVIFTINFFGTFIRQAILPLILLSAVLALANQFSPRIKVGRLADLLRDISGWGLGLCVTLFTGIFAVQGVAGTVTDAVSLRAAKYMTTALVPVVGKMLADSVETVAGASLILKNGIYLAGVAILLLQLIFPLIKLLALIVIYRLTAALVQPLGETGLGGALNALSNCLALMVAAVAAVSVLFVIAVTAVVGAGNVAVMFR
ncbi:MAG: stage III sporulation protein AE [Firmicutes bacterium]|nr:stage III sporulation protein AE [Bacillota bacterium]